MFPNQPGLMFMPTAGDLIRGQAFGPMPLQQQQPYGYPQFPHPIKTEKKWSASDYALCLGLGVTGGLLYVIWNETAGNYDLEVNL